MAQPLSLRLPQETIDRLGSRAEQAQLPVRTLAQRYVEEGLRMDEHPLVRFVDGSGGRRARMARGRGDVWEIVATVRDNDGDLAEAAAHLDLPLRSVQAAVTYYGAHPEEIDGWIERNERIAAKAHAAWLAGQAALRR